MGRAVEEEIGKRQGQRTDRAPADEGQDGLFGGRVRNGAQVGAGQKTRDVAAERAGFTSKDTYERAKAVVDNGVPELVGAMDAAT